MDVVGVGVDRRVHMGDEVFSRLGDDDHRLDRRLETPLGSLVAYSLGVC
jgi:hypothetical protein